MALIEATGDVIGAYVKKTGDTMTGSLEMNTVSAPFIIASNKLVKNLNAELLNGYTQDEFTRRKEDEIVIGNWTFRGENLAEGNWLYKQSLSIYGDFVSSGSLSTPRFASGFGGYGWRLDGQTNTFTIDNLVVRKAMMVYELVINRISATNGAIWVTNAAKVEEAEAIIPITLSDLNSAAVISDVLQSDTCYVFTVTENVIQAGTTIFIGYQYVTRITNLEIVTTSPFWKGIQSLWDWTVLTATWDTLPSTEIPTGATQEDFELYRIHIEAFQLHDLEDPDNPFNFVVQLRYIPFGGGNPTYLDTYLETGQTYALYPYYNYFWQSEASNYWLVTFEDEQFPLFKNNDILRCQKWEDGNIKYYDAIVTQMVNPYTYILQKAPSIFDTYQEIEYGQYGEIESMTEVPVYNNDFYAHTEEYKYDEDDGDVTRRLADITANDDLVQMGNTSLKSRQQAIYITSADDQSPFIDVLVDLNRPDFSVLRMFPIYKKDKYGRYIDINGNVLDEDNITDRVNYNVERDENGNEIGPRTYIWDYGRSTTARFGNLAGIRDSYFPADHQPYGYGLYGQNVFLTGEFYLNNGVSVIEFSQDGVILRYKNAGLSLIDNPNGSGEIVRIEGAEIDLTASGNITVSAGDSFTVRTTDDDGNWVNAGIFGWDSEAQKAYIQTSLIKADELNIREIYNYSYAQSNVSVSSISVEQVDLAYIGDEPWTLTQAPNSAWTTTINGSSHFELTGTSISSAYGKAGEKFYAFSSTVPQRTDGTVYTEVTLYMTGSSGALTYFDVYVYNFTTQTKVPLEGSVYVDGVGRNIYTWTQSFPEGFNPADGWRVIIECLIPTTDYTQITSSSFNQAYGTGELTLKWALREDGSGSLGSGKISWDSNGVMNIDAVTITNAVIDTATIQTSNITDANITNATITNSTFSGAINATGGLILSTRVLTSAEVSAGSVTLLPSDTFLYAFIPSADVPSGGFTINLPASPNNGQIVTIVNSVGASSITLASTTSAVIQTRTSTASTYTIAALDSIQIVYAGIYSTWVVIGK